MIACHQSDYRAQLMVIFNKQQDEEKDCRLNSFIENMEKLQEDGIGRDL